MGDATYDLIDWALVSVTKEPELGQRIDQLTAGLPGTDPARLWAWCRALAVVLAVSSLSRADHDSRTRFLLNLHSNAKP